MVRLTDRTDINMAVYRGRKTTTQQQQQTNQRQCGRNGYRTLDLNKQMRIIAKGKVYNRRTLKKIYIHVIIYKTPLNVR